MSDFHAFFGTAMNAMRPGSYPAGYNTNFSSPQPAGKQTTASAAAQRSDTQGTGASLFNPQVAERIGDKKTLLGGM